MAKSCCIPPCKFSLYDKKTSLHQFPSDPLLRAKWIEIIKKYGHPYLSEKWQPSEDEVICSRHFSSNCFSRRRLRSRVCPNIFIDFDRLKIKKYKKTSDVKEKRKFQNGGGLRLKMEDKKVREFCFSRSPDLEKLRQELETFAKERDWEKYHTPRNLLLAMIGEVGELSEIFQWRGEVKPDLKDWSKEDKQHLGEELSDILLYLIRLSDKCRIDLPKTALEKLDKNRQKYPTKFVYGSSKKYTEYPQNNFTN